MRFGMVAMLFALVRCDGGVNSVPASTNPPDPVFPNPPDPCAGVPTAPLGVGIPLTPAVDDKTPFLDAYAGDGSGNFFLASRLTSSPGTNYDLYLFGSNGLETTEFEGRSADWDHPAPLPTPSGFQMLEGNAGNDTYLNTYSSNGTLLHTTRLATSYQVRAVPDGIGGALLVSMDAHPAVTQTGHWEPWEIYVQRFDQNGSSGRAGRVLVSSNATGDVAVAGVGAAVTASGWTLVVWSTFSGTSTDEIWARWLDPSHTVIGSRDIHLGSTIVGTPANVLPLIAGGAAVQATLADGTAPTWIGRLAEGSETMETPGWLAQFPSTRIAVLRNRSLYAVLLGDPIWAGAIGGPCQHTISIPVIGGDGSACSSVTLPTPLDASLQCTSTLATPIVGLDGSIVVRAAEEGINAAGNTESRLLMAYWPHVFR